MLSYLLLFLNTLNSCTWISESNVRGRTKCQGSEGPLLPSLPVLEFMDFSTSTASQKHFTNAQEMRKAFEEEAQISGKERLLLTAAVAAGKYTIDTAYDIPAISK